MKVPLADCMPESNCGLLQVLFLRAEECSEWMQDYLLDRSHMDESRDSMVLFKHLKGAYLQSCLHNT